MRTRVFLCNNEHDSTRRDKHRLHALINEEVAVHNALTKAHRHFHDPETHFRVRPKTDELTEL